MLISIMSLASFKLRIAFQLKQLLLSLVVEIVYYETVLSFQKTDVFNEVALVFLIKNGRKVGDGVRVGDKRNAIRLNCNYKCLLQHDDIVYPCEMKNISTSGALVDAPDIIPVNIQLGDNCELFFITPLTKSPLNYKSKVTRLEDFKIALHFFDPVSEFRSSLPASL